MTSIILKPFSARELSILKLISRGKKANCIAKELNISVLTVNTHKKNILKKTAAQNMLELIVHLVKGKML